MNLVPLNTSAASLMSVAAQELAVSGYLEQARDWLATAVEKTGPEEIASAKAQIATAAEATKQLGLSKEIQEDAAEMVRRAEWALRKATQKAQEAGEMATREANLRNNSRNDGTSTTTLPKPRDLFASESEYRDALAMGDLDEDEFNEVIAEAKDEGNLSRANVAKKAREKKECELPAPTPAKQKRRPLTDAARDAGWELRKSVERLQRIAADDRFDTNKQQVTPQLRGHLENAIEVCQDLLDRINNN